MVLYVHPILKISVLYMVLIEVNDDCLNSFRFLSRSGVARHKRLVRHNHGKWSHAALKFDYTPNAVCI